MQFTPQPRPLPTQAAVATLRTLDHPNIVKYLGTDRGNHFTILLEYFPGGSIASLLNLFGPMEEVVLRIYLWQVLNGLKYLHQLDIIHGDIKGANILVSNRGVVKLTDFGSSISAVSGAGVHRMILGTVLWRAQEVCARLVMSSPPLGPFLLFVPPPPLS